MSDFHTENERKLFSAKNQPVSFYTEHLLTPKSANIKIKKKISNFVL